MTDAAGSFIWYELMTTDPDASGLFYREVVGWRFVGDDEPGDNGIDYRMIRRDDGGNNGGVLRLTPGMLAGGAQPGWYPYLHVLDVGEATAAIVADGGKQVMPTMTIAAGTIAMMLDPQGVPIYLMTPAPPSGSDGTKSDVFDPMTPQHVLWNELASPDPAASMAFYERRFGFSFASKMSLGDMGDYCFIEHDGLTLGAIMQQMNPGQPAKWLQYFGVRSIAEAKLAVEANGGTVHLGPHEVPGGAWIIVGKDPQGVTFGLVGHKGD